MNSDEMRWLLQTIGDQETAKRFVQAQYERGRISHQMTVDLAREHGWTDYAAVQVLTLPHALMSTPRHCKRFQLSQDQFHEGPTLEAR